MGNRATVIFTDGKGRFSPAVYLHWNGGPESIYSFLEELDKREVRADQDYECARFIQVIGDGLGVSAHSLGVANGPKSDLLEDLEEVQTDHSDNGFYLVNRTTEPLTMRRFLERMTSRDPYESALEEMSAEDVERERREAEGHDYRASFRDEYDEQRKAREKKARAKVRA